MMNYSTANAPATPAFPLPPELFISVCANLTTDDLIAASQVCRAWRQTILDAPLLWSELDGIDLTRAGAPKRVEVILGRAKGGLRAIEFGGAGVEEGPRTIREDDARSELMVGRFEAILAAIASHGGRSSLRQLTLNLDTMDDEGASLGPINTPLLNFCERVATGLTDLTLISRYTTFPGAQPWLRWLPGLRTLIITDDTRNDQPPEVWDVDADGTNDEAASSPVALERWTLSGGCLPDPKFPPMNRLTALKLIDTAVPYLSSLLLACAPSLRELWLAGTDPNFYEPDGALPLAVIAFPALRSAHVGELNAPLWLESQDFDRDYCILTPALEEASWGRTPSADAFVRYRGGGFDTGQTLVAEALEEVLAGCPKVRTVNLDGADVDDGLLEEAWLGAGEGLREVVLGDRATPKALDQLGRLLPRLERVAVATAPASFTALAQMVTVRRQSRGAALAQHTLTIHLVGPNASSVPPRAPDLAAAAVLAIQRLEDAIAAAGQSPMALSPPERLVAEDCWPGDYLAERAGLLEGYAAELRAMVEAAGPLEEEGPRLECWRPSLWDLRDAADTAVAGWLKERMEADAREWLEGQEGVALMCEGGEASGADDDDSLTLSGAEDD